VVEDIIFNRSSLRDKDIGKNTEAALHYQHKGKGRHLSVPAFIIPGDDLLSPARTTIGLNGLSF
jgi:hypothetical protein